MIGWAWPASYPTIPPAACLRHLQLCVTASHLPWVAHDSKHLGPEFNSTSNTTGQALRQSAWAPTAYRSNQSNANPFFIASLFNDISSFPSSTHHCIPSSSLADLNLHPSAAALRHQRYSPFVCFPFISVPPSWHPDRAARPPRRHPSQLLTWPTETTCPRLAQGGPVMASPRSPGDHRGARTTPT